MFSAVKIEHHNYVVLIKLKKSMVFVLVGAKK